MGLLTVLDYACSEFQEKKSRFIGHIAPAANEEEAMAFLSRIRAEHPSARHNCYAWICGENDRWQRSSDAGEPAGTAGRPILEAIKHRDLHNVAIVVTRYFGGILLGAGGLTRAYSKAAVMAIDCCSLVEKVPAQKLAVTFDYTLLGKMDAFFMNNGITVEDKVYGSEVCYICLVETEAVASLPQALADLSGGNARIQCLEDNVFRMKAYNE